MRNFVSPMLALLALAGAIPPPVHAQGQGGYAPGCPGGDTARMSPDQRARARAAHQTNDTNGGRSCIDRSCKTCEGGVTIAGPQPGQISWGVGGAHTRFPGQLR
jgi:hypothetical protein